MLAKLNATVMCKNKGQTQFHITASMTCYKRVPAALVRSSILQVENCMYSVKDLNHKKKWIATELLKQPVLFWHVLILFGNNANTVDFSLLRVRKETWAPPVKQDMQEKWQVARFLN